MDAVSWATLTCSSLFSLSLSLSLSFQCSYIYVKNSLLTFLKSSYEIFSSIPSLSFPYTLITLLISPRPSIIPLIFLPYRFPSLSYLVAVTSLIHYYDNSTPFPPFPFLLFFLFFLPFLPPFIRVSIAYLLPTFIYELSFFISLFIYLFFSSFFTFIYVAT